MTISGKATAPGGQVAMFENKSIMVAFVEFVIPSASAIISGLEPVQGALVELIEIDNDGNQVGDVLASTTTLPTGGYTLTLPEGVNLAANLVVRITGTNVELRAQVVEQTVDISPLSEFLLRKFIVNPSALGTIPVNMVVTLAGHAEEFNLAAASNIDATLAALEKELGQFVDDSIKAITAEPGSASAIAGDVHVGSFELRFSYMVLPDMQFYDIAQSSSLNTENTSLLDDGGNNIGIGESSGGSYASSGLQTQDNVNYRIGYHLESYSSDEQFHNIGIVDIDNNIYLTLPFDDDFWDDLSFVEHSPPRIMTLYASGIPGTFVQFQKVDTDIYRLIDTDGDTLNDTIDLNALVGHEDEIGINILAKHSSGVTSEQFNGEYGSVYLIEGFLDLGGTTGLISGVVDSTVTAGILTETAEDAILILRSPNGDGAVMLQEIPMSGPTQLDTGTFTLPNDNGEFTFQEDGNDLSFIGFSSGDLGELIFMDVTGSDETSDGMGGSFISSTTMGFSIAVRKPAAMPNLAARSYRLMGMEKSFATDGEITISRIRGDDDRLIFSGDGLQITATYNDVDTMSRPNDVSDFIDETVDESGEMIVDVSLDQDGAINFTERNTDSAYTREWKGFVSGFGNLIVLKVTQRSDDGTRFSQGFYLATALN
jgi:hypothetical protein